MWYKKFICQLFYAKFRGTAKSAKKFVTQFILRNWFNFR